MSPFNDDPPPNRDDPKLCALWVMLGIVLNLGVILLASCAFPVRVDPSSVMRVEIQNAPTAENEPAPFVVSPAGSAEIEMQTASGTVAGQVTFYPAEGKAAPAPQPPPGPDWLGVVSKVLGIAGLLAGGGGVGAWVARAGVRLVSAYREAYAADMEKLAAEPIPQHEGIPPADYRAQQIEELKAMHKARQIRDRVHAKVQKARGKA